MGNILSPPKVSTPPEKRVPPPAQLPTAPVVTTRVAPAPPRPEYDTFKR